MRKEVWCRELRPVNSSAHFDSGETGYAISVQLRFCNRLCGFSLMGARMDKMIVIVFDSDPAAYAGARALKELHWEGSITLYSGSVIAKEVGGKIELKQVINFGQIGSVLGKATGALVGALADDPGGTAVKTL
ncbi:MAG: hypothetical protein ACREF4_06125, partial [Gammaproteobacteria bacterium]